MEGSDRNVIQAIVSVNPGLAFIKFWQGIVEISLRGLAIVSYTFNFFFFFKIPLYNNRHWLSYF